MTTRALSSLALVLVVGCAGCASRLVPKAPGESPSGTTRDGASERAASASASEGSAIPAAGVETAAPVALAAPTDSDGATDGAKPSEDGTAPPATASVFVFSPQQAASAPPPSAPSPEDAPDDAPAPSAAAELVEDAGPGELYLAVIASTSQIAPGAILTVDVIAASRTAVVDAPLHLTFDPRVVEFVDGTTGDFLTQGGSGVVFLADGLSRPGDVAIAAGRIERVAGARGTGLLCRVRFRGVATGTTPVQIGSARAWGTGGEELTVLGGGTSVAVD